MKKVYKTKQSQLFLTELYDKQMKALNIEFEDMYIDTRYGKSHIIKAGKQDGKPLLLFHGGNSTTPYYLSGFVKLLDDFCIFAVDTMGHPGKSAQAVLSSKNMQYGEWASDVISGLSFNRMCCMGGSFGGGVLVKLMCVAPEKIEKSVLIVPSGIANVSAFNVMVKMGIPMISYILTKNEKWLKKAIIPMAIEEKNIDANTYEMVKGSFEHAVVKAGLPSNVSAKELKKYLAPTLLIASEKDCLFPGQKVISRAKEVISNLQTYLLKGQGHLCVLDDDKINLIRDFINE